MPRGQINSWLKDCNMIAKNCQYHKVRVIDLECKNPSIESLPVVKEFPEGFSNNLLGVPP